MPDFIFFGTDEFAVAALDELAKPDPARGGTAWRPKLIITTPDQPQGRALKLTPPPVKIWAEQQRLPCLQPAQLTDFNLINQLAAANCPLFIVAAYGKIIPQEVLALPKLGALNLHPSLLPKYRGPSPLQTAILNGDAETGVTIMKLDEQMDHGPIVAQESFPLPTISFQELRDALAKLGAQQLSQVLTDYAAGKITLTEQDHAAATYTKKFTKADAEIKLNDPADYNYRKILALNPNPGTWLVDERGTRLKIISARLESGTLKFERVIPAGKKEMSWDSYQRGQH